MIPESYDNSFFDFQRMQSYKSASIILPFVNQWIRPNSVIDVGCGVGAWLKATEALHINTITGLDGDYVPADKLLISKDQFIATDLEKEIKVNRKYDLAICLEVAEHLSSKRAAPFIAELCELSDTILFSAAVPGQEGTLHINEQYPDYWTGLFEKNNYTCFDCLRPVIWKNAAIEFWYKQNIMLFVSNKAIDKYPVLKTLPTFNGNNIIHPDLLAYKTNKAEYFKTVLHNPVKGVRYYLSKIYHSIIK